MKKLIASLSIVVLLTAGFAFVANQVHNEVNVAIDPGGGRPGD